MTAKIKLNAASGGGSFSLQAPSSSSNNRIFTLPDSADATILTSTASLGKILQVKQTVKTDKFTATANASNFFDITGLSVDITMSSASNKVLVFFTASWTGNNGQRGSFRLVRGSTDIGVGDARGSRTRAFFGSLQTSSDNQCLPVAGQFLDTPSSGTHTYKLQVGGESGVGTLTINANQSDGDGNDKFVGVSTITVMEIAA